MFELRYAQLPAQQLRQQRVAQSGEGAELAEVGGNSGVERLDLGGEGGHEFLRREHDRNRAVARPSISAILV